MKKEKFEIKVNNLILLILDWCEKKKLRCVQNGLSVYFDLFSAFMQAFILISLTMAYVSSAKERE